MTRRSRFAEIASRARFLGVCDDGIDDDGDGLTEFPADPGCSVVFPDASEVNEACGLGFEISFLLPLLIPLRSAARRFRARHALCASAHACSASSSTFLPRVVASSELALPCRPRA